MSTHYGLTYIPPERFPKPAWAVEMDTAAESDRSQPRKPASSDLLEEIRSGVLESRDSVEILSWAIEKFHPRLALSP